MPLWVVREQEQRYGPGAMEHLREGGSSPAPLTLGMYTTLAAARDAVAARLRILFGGGDCFTAPSPGTLHVEQRWEADGTGTICLCAPPAQSYGGYEADSSDLTLSIEAHAVDVPPPLDQRPFCWSGLEDAAGYVRPAPPPPPPLTEEEAAEARAADAALARAQAARQRELMGGLDI